MSKLSKPVGPPGTLDEWGHRFELLADPTRLRLLTHMHLHPGCPVNELSEAAGITQTAASQALRVLREKNWVRAERYLQRRGGPAIFISRFLPVLHSPPSSVCWSRCP